MSEEHNPDKTEEAENHAAVNRRRFVKAFGVMGSAAFIGGVPSIAAAESVDIDVVRQSRSVDRLLAALNNPTVTDRQAKTIKIGTTEIVEVRFETGLGTLIHAEFRSTETPRIENGDTAVMFNFDDQGAAFRHELPVRFRNLPTGVETTLVFHQGNTILRRNTTKKEKNLIANIVDTNEFTAIYGSDHNGYYVDTDSGGNYRIIADSSDQLTTDAYTVEPLAAPAQDDCFDHCFDCAVASGDCAFCAPRCTSIISLPLCAYCIYLNCRDVAGPCSRCIGCAI